MRHQNSYALDTSWEAALLNIKSDALQVYLVLDNILLPLSLQSLSDTLFSLLLCFLQKNLQITGITFIPKGSEFLASPFTPTSCKVPLQLKILVHTEVLFC